VVWNELWPYSPDPASKGDGFPDYPVTVRRPELPLRCHIDPPANHTLQIEGKPRMVKKAGLHLELHEQVQVTVRPRVSPGNGAEYADIPGAVGCSHP